MPYISENIKIICAICDKFFRPLSSGAAEEDDILAAKMKFLSKEINSLKSFVEENNLERKSAKWEITEDIKDFPFLGEQELRNITCEVYQLKLSPSYIQEYLDGKSQILIHKEDPGLIRVKYTVGTYLPNNIFYGSNSQNLRSAHGTVSVAPVPVLSVSVPI